MRSVFFQDLGLIDYKTCWDYQQQLFDSIIAKKLKNRDSETTQEIIPNYLLFCEHPKVFTLGKSGSVDNLLFDTQKLEAEQNALRMEFTLQEERQEAERKRIQAEGVRDAQNIISQGLNNDLLRFKAIEAFVELSKSPNAKVIITDGNSMPLMANPDMTEVPKINTNYRLKND